MKSTWPDFSWEIMTKAQLKGLQISLSNFSFVSSGLNDLEKIRLLLYEKEEESRFISALY